MNAFFNSFLASYYYYYSCYGMTLRRDNNTTWLYRIKMWANGHCYLFTNCCQIGWRWRNHVRVKYTQKRQIWYRTCISYSSYTRRASYVSISQWAITPCVKSFTPTKTLEETVVFLTKETVCCCNHAWDEHFHREISTLNRNTNLENKARKIKSKY